MDSSRKLGGKSINPPKDCLQVIMNTDILIATSVTVIFIAIIYARCGYASILNCYKMWFKKEYWTSYNIIEAASWIAKAIIIIPALIFNNNIWELYFISLITSMSLIWASNKKLLPTLVGFNTLWIWLSMMVIVKNI